jgi:hypothetical protein
MATALMGEQIGFAKSAKSKPIKLRYKNIFGTLALT